MSTDSTPSDGDFQNALLEELGVDPATDDTKKPENPTGEENDGAGQTPPASSTEGKPPVDKPKDGEPEGSQGGEQKTDEEIEAEKVAGETAEETAQRHEKEAADKAAAEPEKPLTAEDIADLLDKRQASSSERIDRVQAASKEVISKLYPQGIDKNVYDSEGKVIKTAQDIVDRGLINEATGEAYTYEQAAAFMMEAGRKMTENIAELDKYAEEIGERNVSLIEGNQRVMAKYAELLGTKDKPGILPQEDVKMLAETYIKTQLKFDKTDSYVTEMAMSPEQYYDLALAPYAKINAQQAAIDEAKAEADAKAERERREAEQREQDERNNLPGQRGSAKQKSNTGNANTDAFIDAITAP